MKTLNIVIAGASGLIGRAVLKELSQQNDLTAVALVRKPGLLKELIINSPIITEKVFDYENSEHLKQLGAEIPCDIFLCCLGSTIKAAGSQEAFKRIEHDYPLLCLENLKKNNSKSVFAFVSSMGAGNPKGFYLKNKRATEKQIELSEMKFVIVRPSLLLGERKEFRMGERLANHISRPLFGVLKALQLNRIPLISSIEPIQANDVAKALIRVSLDLVAGNKSSLILENKSIKDELSSL